MTLVSSSKASKASKASMHLRVYYSASVTLVRSSKTSKASKASNASNASKGCTYECKAVTLVKLVKDAPTSVLAVYTR